MAQSTAGTAKDLNDGRAEALQALLSSLSPPGVQSSSSTKLSPAQLQNLSNKIDELLGGADAPNGPHRNEKGELVNEDGLPIIDITEPLAQSVATEDPQPALLIDAPDLVPLTQLSSLEKERRRRERDRILDLLEAEESNLLAKNEEEEEERRREILRKRKEAAKLEMEKLKAAKEMQKKMGKALIRNIAEAREKEEKARKELEQAVEVKEEPSSSKPRKCVTFADVPPEDAQAEDGGEDHTTTTKDGLDWGDVAPARLRAHNHLSLVAKAQAEKSPMKMQVVERHPASLRGGEESTQDKDSDDESDIASSAPSSSSEPELEGDDDEVGDQDVLDDDFDWDSVRHQREVALEYYKKRLAIGADATQAMTSHTHDEDEWDQPEVPLDATLSSSRPKPAVSRFKADRIASSYNVSQPSASTSLGPSVIPASGQKSLQGAVRVGKLQNDQLVGGEAGESGSEDERVKEVLEMLKGGQIQNAGPDFVPPVKPSDANAPSEPSLQPQVDINPPVAAPTPSRASQKPSKFKLARKQHTVDPPSVPNTPISTVNRSSPRLPVSGVVERNAPRPRPREQYVSPQIVQPTGMTGGTLGGKPVMPSMVVDSPSFPAHHMVVDSPSFPGPTQLRRPDRPPAVMSTTVKEKAQGSTRQ